MKNLVSLSLICLLLSGISLKAEPFIEQFEVAFARARTAHEERTETLLTAYRAHLDRLIAAAQPEGDIESIVVFLDEKANPGVGPADPRITQLRGTLQQQMERIQAQWSQDQIGLLTRLTTGLGTLVQEATRGGDLERAQQLRDRMIEAETRIAALQPDPAAATQQTARRLGDNLLPSGDFEERADDRWRFRIPDSNRNRSGIYTESRAETRTANRNRALRLQQHESSELRITHPVSVQAGQQYEISWRARLLTPWRHGIELRGHGSYHMGFHIPHHRFQTLSLLEQASVRRSATTRIEPPMSTEWERKSVTVQAHPHMIEFILTVSSGEGDWLIDDLQIRPVLPDS